MKISLKLFKKSSFKWRNTSSMSGLTDDGSTETEDHATPMRVRCPSPEFPASSGRFNDPADAVSEQHTDAVRVCQPSQISLSAGVDNGVGAMSERDNTVALSLKSQSSQVYFMIGCQRSGSNWLRTMLSEREDLIAPHPPHIMREFMSRLKKFGDLTLQNNLRVCILLLISENCEFSCADITTLLSFIFCIRF